MCPVCYVPWLITILGFFGINAHLWMDANPIISIFMIVISIGMMIWGGLKLYKYFTKERK